MTPHEVFAAGDVLLQSGIMLPATKVAFSDVWPA